MDLTLLPDSLPFEEQMSSLQTVIIPDSQPGIAFFIVIESMKKCSWPEQPCN